MSRLLRGSSGWIWQLIATRGAEGSGLLRALTGLHEIITELRHAASIIVVACATRRSASIYFPMSMTGRLRSRRAWRSPQPRPPRGLGRSVATPHVHTQHIVDPSQIPARVEELRERGFAVVVAHPKRAAQSATAAATLTHELAAGKRVATDRDLRR